MIGLEKILRKDKSIKPTAREEELVKQLISFEMQSPETKKLLENFGFLAVEEVKVNQATTALLVTIPFPLLKQLKEISNVLVPNLEEHFKAPVLFVAKRKIISRHLKVKRVQQIPRSRTLTSVHKQILADLIYPLTIVECREHVKVDGSSTHKISFNEKAAELLKKNDKKQAIEAIYKKLTCKTLYIDLVPVVSRLPKKKKEAPKEETN
jgi:small subunit ribosomal protein S7e